MLPYGRSTSETSDSSQSLLHVLNGPNILGTRDFRYLWHGGDKRRGMANEVSFPLILFSSFLSRAQSKRFWKECSHFQTFPYPSKNAERCSRLLAERRGKVVTQTWKPIGGLHSLLPSTEASSSKPEHPPQIVAGTPVLSFNTLSASAVKEQQKYLGDSRDKKGWTAESFTNLLREEVSYAGVLGPRLCSGSSKETRTRVCKLGSDTVPLSKSSLWVSGRPFLKTMPHSRVLLRIKRPSKSFAVRTTMTGTYGRFTFLT